MASSRQLQHQPKTPSQHHIPFTCCPLRLLKKMQTGAMQESFIEPVEQHVQTLTTVSAGMGQAPLASESTRAGV